MCSPIHVPFSSVGHSAQEAAMCWPQLTGSCCQGSPPSQTSSPNGFHVQDDEQLFDPKMERFFSFGFVFSSRGSRHLPSGSSMSKDRKEVFVRDEALGRRVNTCDFSFRLHDIIVRKLEYSCKHSLLTNSPLGRSIHKRTSVFAEIQGFACSTAAGTSFNFTFSSVNFAFSSFSLAFSFLSASSPVLTFWQPPSPSQPSPVLTGISSCKCFIVCGCSPGRRRVMAT